MYFSARMRKANEDLAAVRNVTNDTVDGNKDNTCHCVGIVHQNDCKHWVLPL
jgi:hypothetical protein